MDIQIPVRSHRWQDFSRACNGATPSNLKTALYVDMLWNGHERVGNLFHESFQRMTVLSNVNAEAYIQLILTTSWRKMSRAISRTFNGHSTFETVLYSLPPLFVDQLRERTLRTLVAYRFGMLIALSVESIPNAWISVLDAKTLGPWDNCVQSLVLSMTKS